MQRSDKSILLTEKEINILEDVFYLEPWLQDAIDYRRRKGHKYKVKLADEDLRDCVHALMQHAELKEARRENYIALARKIIQYEALIPAVNCN